MEHGRSLTAGITNLENVVKKIDDFLSLIPGMEKFFSVVILLFIY
jgi:hypothetical protein